MRTIGSIVAITGAKGFAMADFCKQCSIENFGEDYGDLAQLRPEVKLEDGEGFAVLCEGCGSALVIHDGTCIARYCDKEHGLIRDEEVIDG